MSKILTRRIERVCKRKLRRGNLSEAHAKAVKAIIRDQLGMKLLTQRVDGMPSFASVGRVEGVVIDWIVANFDKILKFILAIVAALGLL